MTRIERSIEIRASPEKVWELQSCERTPEWYPGIKRHEFTSEKRGLGATYHVAGEGDGQRFESPCYA